MRPARQSSERSSDTLYKILVYKVQVRGAQRVGDISLSIAACHRLLSVKPSDMNHSSSQMTLEELMQKATVTHSAD